MDALSLSVTFREFLHDRRTYCRMEAFVPGRAAPDWRGDGQLAMACGHAGLFEVGVVECRDFDDDTVVIAVHSASASFWARFLPLGQFEVGRLMELDWPIPLRYYGDAETLGVLIASGLDVRQRLERDLSPLHCVSNELVLEARRECALVLLERGAPWTEQDLDAELDADDLDDHLTDALKLCVDDREAGMNRLRSLIKPEQLTIAVRRGDLPRIRELIDEEHVDPNDGRWCCIVCDRAVPLHEAIQHRHDDCVEFLLSRGAHVTEECFNRCLRRGLVRSLLLLAHHAPEVFRRVERWEGNWLTREAGRSLQEDVEEGMKQLRSLLPHSDLMNAARRGDVRAVRTLLARPWLDSDSHLGGLWCVAYDKALESAAAGAHWHVVRALVEAADVDADVLKHILWYACTANDARSALFLLRHGAPVDRFMEDSVPSFHPRLKEAMRVAVDDREEGMRMLREMVGK